MNRRKVALGVYLAWVGLTLYWTVAMTGPVRWLSSWQLRTWGSYYGVVTMLILHLPVIFALRLASGRRPLTESASELFEGIPVFPLLVLCIGVGMGGWLYLRGRAAGQLRKLATSELAGAKLGRVAYVELSGFATTSYLTLERGGARTVYLPLIGAAGELPAVIVEMHSGPFEKLSPNADGTVTVKGTLESKLPGEIRLGFTHENIPIADHASLLRTNVSPSKDKKVGVGLIVAGVLIGAALYANERRRRAREPAAVA